MTPTSHNKILGILHVAYGGFMSLLMAVMTIFFLAMMSNINNNGEPFPVVGLVFFAIMFGVITLLHVVPSFLAGYALLKRKRWAKTMGIIAAIFAGLNFPLGSALCVYTLWFLFGESGRFLYHKAAYALPPGDSLWTRTTGRELEREYVPPSAPPDWR